MEEITITKKEYEELLEKAKKYDDIRKQSKEKGAKAWAGMSPEERKERARLAGIASAKKRWGDKSIKVEKK